MRLSGALGYRVPVHDCPPEHQPGWRFDIRRGPRPGSKCLRHAAMYGPILRTAVLTALVVGSVLTAINQGNVLVDGRFPGELWWKIPLTYCVPFCVATWAALRATLVR